jgi:hypothetical protein
MGDDKAEMSVRIVLVVCGVDAWMDGGSGVEWRVAELSMIF